MAHPAWGYFIDETSTYMYYLEREMTQAFLEKSIESIYTWLGSQTHFYRWFITLEKKKWESVLAESKSLDFRTWLGPRKLQCNG